MLAVIVGEVTLSLVKRSGRLGGYSDSEADAFKERILDVLRKVGVAERELPHVMVEWHRFTEFDYAHLILGGGAIPDSTDKVVLAEWNGLRSGGIARIPTPEEIRAFLQRHGFMTAELAGYLEDYEYYRTHRSHLRSEVWLKRHEWGRLRKP